MRIELPATEGTPPAQRDQIIEVVVEEVDKYAVE
jgi:hypothetical protein